jgi:hypothetical protein
MTNILTVQKNLKKSEHLVFWSGDYQTNLISDNGTGEKLELIIGKYIQVLPSKKTSEKVILPLLSLGCILVP